jgi:AraC-like DNA-binding protein
MDRPIDSSILNAIEQGRGQRGRRAPQAWSRHRAQVLTAAQRELSLIRIAGELGLSRGHLNTLFEEACDAVLRGGAVSDVADGVCAERWRRWCDNGDTAACGRLQMRHHG